MAYTYKDYKKMYAEKKRTLQECLDMIQSGDHICFGKDCNEPLLFCQQLHTVAHRVEDVVALGALGTGQHVAHRVLAGVAH